MSALPDILARIVAKRRERLAEARSGRRGFRSAGRRSPRSEIFGREEHPFCPRWQA